MTAYTITTAVSFSDMDGAGTDYAAGDSLTINSGGQVTADISIAGAGSLVIAVNAGGLFIQNAGTSLKIADSNSILVAEGGRWRSLGTAISRCTVVGSNQATTTHRFATNEGGKIYLDYTDVSAFYYLGSLVAGSIVELHNSTISGCNQGLYTTGYGTFLLVNSTITQTQASRYCLNIANHGHVTAINCAFTSASDNWLANAAYTVDIVFAGCTYQGVAINANDFPTTATDYNLRIYEKSVVTCSGNLASVAIAALHPSADSYGLLYDSTNFMKIPQMLAAPPSDASGVSNIYTLQKSAYWPSGLALVSRTWKYWSDSSQAETGDNQKFTVGAYKSGYSCTGTTAWAGATAAITMVATKAYIRTDGGTFT